MKKKRIPLQVKSDNSIHRKKPLVSIWCITIFNEVLAVLWFDKEDVAVTTALKQNLRARWYIPHEEIKILIRQVNMKIPFE